MDAWWPLLVRGAFEPALGKDTYDRFIGFKLLDNEPNNHGAHLGSAYQGGTYGLVQKDLRTLLGRKRLKRLKGPPGKKSRYSRTYCGGTKRRRGTLRPLPPRAGVHAGPGHGQDARPSSTARTTSASPSPASGPPTRAAAGRRPVLLRLDLDARARRRAAAGDPLDQPADLPAGSGDPGPCPALGPSPSRGRAGGGRRARARARDRRRDRAAARAERLRVDRRGRRRAPARRTSTTRPACSPRSATSPRSSTSPARPRPAEGRA